MDQIILLQIHPTIRKYIVYMWEQTKIGVNSRNMQILKIASSVKNEENTDTKFANKFTVSIPYAGRFIEWEVKFNNENFDFAPDFDVGDDTFLAELTIDEIQNILPSWCQWDSSKPASLYDSLMELLKAYKLYQLSLLDEKYSRIQLDLTKLMNATAVNGDEIEIYIDQSGDVHFLIDLNINFSCLPSEFFKNPDKLHKNTTVLLMISFSRKEGNNVQTQIYFTPAIDQNLLGFDSKVLPSFTSVGSLLDYVHKIQNLLQDKIQSIVENITFKEHYITYLLSEYPNNILEYDNIHHTKASLIFETNHFCWLLIIVISNNFPKEKPKWTLRSIYQTAYDEPASEILVDYPYSPRWDVAEMVTRALKYALEKIPHFQNKNNKGSFT